MSGNARTLWLWDTLPQKGLKSEEQTWLKEGDAVENVHRLSLGKISNLLIGYSISRCKTIIPTR